MPAHQRNDAVEIGNINLRRRNLFARDCFSHSSRAFEVDVGDRNLFHLTRIVRKIVNRAQSHSSCPEYENLHLCCPLTLFKSQFYLGWALFSLSVSPVMASTSPPMISTSPIKACV